MRKAIMKALVFVVFPLSVLLCIADATLEWLFGYEVRTLGLVGGIGILSSLSLAFLLGRGKPDEKYTEKDVEAGSIRIESDALVVGDGLRRTECERIENVPPGEYSMTLRIREASDWTDVVGLTMTKGDVAGTERLLELQVDVETYALMIVDSLAYEQRQSDKSARKWVAAATKESQRRRGFSFLLDTIGRACGVVVSPTGESEPVYPISTRRGQAGGFELHIPMVDQVPIEE